MIYRSSIVKRIKTHAVSNSGIFQIGDSYYLKPVSYAFAVQREYPLIYATEGNLSEYKVFTKPFPKVSVTENVKMNIFNENPTIYVNDIYILGVAASGILHIGSTCKINAESRVKHIRQLLDD